MLNVTKLVYSPVHCAVPHFWFRTFGVEVDCSAVSVVASNEVVTQYSVVNRCLYYTCPDKLRKTSELSVIRQKFELAATSLTFSASGDQLFEVFMHVEVNCTAHSRD